MPTSNATGVHDANTKEVFQSNGFVTYVQTIQELNGIVSRLMSCLSKAVCVYEIHWYVRTFSLFKSPGKL